jgi:hypothetical protein
VIEYWDFYADGYDAPDGGMGMGTTLPVDGERDFGAELRQAVEDVTGRPVDVPPKRRIGFV